MTTRLKLFTVLLLPLCLATGCNKFKNANKDMEKDKNCLALNNISFEGKEDFLKHIEKNRISFYDAGNNISFREMYTSESVPFVIPILSYWLNQKGCKPVSSYVFSSKLKDIFNIDKSRRCENIYLGKDYIWYDTYQSYETEGGTITKGTFLFSTKYNLFLRPPFNGYVVEEIDRTQRYQTCFPEELFHYNNFIFHDDSVSARWLANNDVKFIELLVKEFGYDQNEKMNRAVIKYVYNNYKNPPRQVDPGTTRDPRQLINFFAHRDCYGTFRVHKGIMETIGNITTVDDTEYLDWLNFIHTILTSNGEKDIYDVPYEDFNEREKLQLLAYICYYIEKTLIEKGLPEVGLIGGRPSEYMMLKYTLKYRPEMLQLLKDNDYFGLPGYEEMVWKRLTELEEE